MYKVCNGQYDSLAGSLLRVAREQKLYTSTASDGSRKRNKGGKCKVSSEEAFEYGQAGPYKNDQDAAAHKSCGGV